MKKTILIVLGLVVLLASCDRKSFVKKLVGTYHLDRYLFDGFDKTVYYDTTYRDWQMTLTEQSVKGVYSKTWKDYVFTPDSAFLVDTLGYDTPNMVYILRYDTLHFIDTAITPHMELGTWELINSEEDLQLRNDSSNAVEIYRILELTRTNLNLRKGNEEFYYKK